MLKRHLTFATVDTGTVHSTDTGQHILGGARFCLVLEINILIIPTLGSLLQQIPVGPPKGSIDLALYTRDHGQDEKQPTDFYGNHRTRSN